MVERGGLSIEATIGVITRRYNLSGVNFTPSSLDENILHLSVIVEMTEATRSTRGNSNFPKKGKKSLSIVYLKKEKGKDIKSYQSYIPDTWTLVGALGPGVGNTKYLLSRSKHDPEC